MKTVSLLSHPIARARRGPQRASAAWFSTRRTLGAPRWGPRRALSVLLMLIAVAALGIGRVGGPIHAQQTLKPVPPGGSREVQQTLASEDADAKVFHVQRNVYMLVGAGANIAVQVGDEGVLVVDTGLGQMSEKVLAAIRTLSDQPIRWVINTHLHPDHTGGNEAISKAGSTRGT